MEPRVVVFLVCLLTIGAIHSFRLAWPTLDLAVHALRLRGMGPGDVHSGPVAVTGRPRPIEDTVESPWTDEDCVAFNGQVHRRAGSSRHGNEWRPVRTLGREAPFELSGPTGRVLVDPDDAELHMKETYRAFTDDRRETPPAPDEIEDTTFLDSLLGRHSSGDHRYVEERIDPDDQVTVFGVAEYDAADDPRPRIGGSYDSFDPPFTVYVNDSDDPLRTIVVETAQYIAASLGCLIGAVWLSFQVYSALT